MVGTASNLQVRQRVYQGFRAGSATDPILGCSTTSVPTIDCATNSSGIYLGAQLRPYCRRFILHHSRQILLDNFVYVPREKVTSINPDGNDHRPSFAAGCCGTNVGVSFRMLSAYRAIRSYSLITQMPTIIWAYWSEGQALEAIPLFELALKANPSIEQFWLALCR